MVWPSAYGKWYQDGKTGVNGGMRALIDTGVQILTPIPISASGMNPVRLKQEFGRDLVC